MKEENSLDLRADRRQFTVAAMLAMLGGVSITISGCGKATSSTTPSTPLPVADNNGTLSTNHGHLAVITSAQLVAGSDLVLSLRGTSSHDHTLELSAAEVMQIRDGRTLVKECSGTTHRHTVTFN